VRWRGQGGKKPEPSWVTNCGKKEDVYQSATKRGEKGGALKKKRGPKRLLYGGGEANLGKDWELGCPREGGRAVKKKTEKKPSPKRVKEGGNLLNL